MSFNKKFFTTGGIVASAPPAAAAFDPLQNFETVTYTGNGSTQKITGYIRKGAAFNGSSSKIDIPAITINSVSFWVYLNNFSSTHAIFGSSSDTSKYLYINTDGTVLINTQTDLTPSTSIQSATWEHIVLTESGGIVTMYLNGQSVGTVSSTLGGWNQIGARTSGTAQYLDGKLDQVRIFNKALSSSEVTTLYGETYASSTKSTTDIFNDGSGVALYELDEDANTTPYYPYGTGDIDAGQSAVFNGSSSRISTSTISGLSDVSVSLWLRSTNSSSTLRRGVIDLNAYSSGNLLPGTLSIFYRYSDGAISVRSGNSNSTQATVLDHTDTTLRDGDWHNLIATRNESSGVTTLYIDGSQVDQETVSFTSTVGNSTLIGDRFTNGSGYNWDGQIDQVRIYSSALSASDVEALVSETNVPTANLVAHYKLDGDATDEQGSYNGTATNITYSDPAEFPNVAYNGTPTNVNFLGMAFQPDLVWVKKRDGVHDHKLADSVRGATNILESSTTDAEITAAGSINAFHTNGFSVGSDSSVNGNGFDFVAWCWKAGGDDVLNEEGSIDSQVSANQDAGFSIVTFNKTTNASTASTFGHGLSAAPEMIVLKRTDGAEDWLVYHISLGNSKRIQLNSTAAQTTGTNVWGQTDPTATVFTVESFNPGNAIAYCFHSVDGYQKLGSYTGTGSAGNAQSIGFQPKFILGKSYDNTEDWFIVDSPRGGNKYLKPNLSNAEATAGASITFTSTGFEFTGGSFNNSGMNFIYLAIA